MFASNVFNSTSLANLTAVAYLSSPAITSTSALAPSIHLTNLSNCGLFVDVTWNSLAYVCPVPTAVPTLESIFIVTLYFPFFPSKLALNAPPGVVWLSTTVSLLLSSVTITACSALLTSVAVGNSFI